MFLACSITNMQIKINLFFRNIKRSRPCIYETGCKQGSFTYYLSHRVSQPRLNGYKDQRNMMMMIMMMMMIIIIIIIGVRKSNDHCVFTTNIFLFDKKVTQITFILLFIAHHIIQHN